MRETLAEIEVRAEAGPLFEGEAELREGRDGFDWSLWFRVPNTRVAQFQMCRGEEVRVQIAGAGDHRMWIGGFAFDADASASGAGGHGRIELLGRGEPPRSARAVRAG